ncbi:MAG: glycine--tRNA ligase subunit beta [Campylobacterales bacterium]|nr:glycine--tRNA ligase subunit beta [Campylobacterales bacterium]
MQKPLLIEIGVEELPAIPLLKIIKQIEKNWADILQEYALVSEFKFLYTPRRLVLIHTDMANKQDDSVVEFFGPPMQIAFKEGEATKATLGFAAKCGVSVEELERATKGDKEILYYKKSIEGRQTADLLQEMLSKWLGSMSFGKMMRWGSRSEEFIRPVRWLQVRLGDDVVPLSLYGVESANLTFVHRMVSFEPREVTSINDYYDILKEGAVILSPKERKALIQEHFDAIEAKYNILIERDQALLDEVVAITENPTALLGSFDESFLELPPEVIITSMKEHQRYFAVFKEGHLANKFIVVSNAYTHDFSKVIAGNERVLKPRLADGMFFYYNDLRNGLTTKGLEKIQFMDGLGSLKDKIDREANIAVRLLHIYDEILEKDCSKDGVELAKLINRAVHLSKADLMSEMVYEFTELQGLMGYYYAKAAGEEEVVCNAIKEQYMPVGDGAELPSSIFGALVSISIKLDTVMALFSIGKIPTGSKDPFALRRAVNGIIRMVTHYDLPFNLNDVIDMLKEGYAAFDTNALKEFILERVNKLSNVNPSLISAVLASGEMDINELFKKIDALDTIVAQADFNERFSTFKRVANISKEVDLDGSLPIDTTLFSHDAEVKLYNHYIQVTSKKYESYVDELNALFSLKESLDNYFDDVMVNVEDEAIKTNRLYTVASIYKSFKAIADIKEISI